MVAIPGLAEAGGLWELGGCCPEGGFVRRDAEPVDAFGEGEGGGDFELEREDPVRVKAWGSDDSISAMEGVGCELSAGAEGPTSTQSGAREAWSDCCTRSRARRCPWANTRHAQASHRLRRPSSAQPSEVQGELDAVESNREQVEAAEHEENLCALRAELESTPSRPAPRWRRRARSSPPRPNARTIRGGPGERARRAHSRGQR